MRGTSMAIALSRRNSTIVARHEVPGLEFGIDAPKGLEVSAQVCVGLKKNLFAGSLFC
jgi:hypothetical protein